MRKGKPDHYIVLLVGILLLIGLLIIYSVGPTINQNIIGDYSQNYFLYRQLFNIAIGILAFAFAARVKTGFWIKFLPVIVGLASVSNLLLLVPGIGITENGATRWIGISAFSFQPVELLKLATLLYMANLLSAATKQQLAQKKEVLIKSAVVLAITSFLVIFMQRDMGTMLVIAVMVIGMLFAAGLAKSQLAAIVGSFGVLGAASIVFFPHRVARFLTFVNPDSDLQGSGYHVQQVLIAIGSGGISGLGLGKSIQSYGYVPESANDSVFAIFAEKFGFIGSVGLLVLFSLLLFRVFKVASKNSDKFQRYLSVGVLLWIFGHIAINVGAMLALLPLTGITLPFLSYGGSSLLFIMLILGMTYQASRYSGHTGSKLKKSKNGRLHKRQWRRA